MLLYCFVLLTPNVISALTTRLPPLTITDTASVVAASTVGTVIGSNVTAPVHLDDFDMPLYNGSGSDSGLDEDLVYLSSSWELSSRSASPSSSSSFSAITNAGNQINDLRSDINDFVALIPVEEVRNVIGNYYRNNKDIRLAFAYLKDSKFLERLLNVTEIQHLVRYLNETGLDVVDVVNRIAELLGDTKYYETTSSASLNNGDVFGNETEFHSGIHVMVDSVLDVIPQDEILNMFFEKMDASPAFTTFFSKVREPKFGHMLQKVEESAGLKYLIYTLHNHGINMEKIVDSLKNYFFLGTF